MNAPSWRNTSCILVAIILFASSPAKLQANDASFEGDGATVYATKENRVQMIRENILIRYDKNKKTHEWVAECEFEFENQSKEPLTIQMGFPNWRNWSEESQDHFMIRDFRVEIDGVPVKAKSRFIDQEKNMRPWKGASKPATFDGALTWTVAFKPQERKVVRNTFSFGGFISYGPFNILNKMPESYPRVNSEDTFWESRKPGKDDLDFANAMAGAIAYITTTGLTWRPPIRKAEITIELSPWMQENPHLIIPLPHGYHHEKDRITLEI